MDLASERRPEAFEAPPRQELVEVQSPRGRVGWNALEGDRVARGLDRLLIARCRRCSSRSFAS